MINVNTDVLGLRLCSQVNDICVAMYKDASAITVAHQPVSYNLIAPPYTRIRTREPLRVTALEL